MAVIKRETGRGFAATDSTASVFTAMTTEQTLFSHTIVGGYMSNNKELRFNILCALTSPMLSVPTITVKVKLGSSVINIMQGLTLATGQNNAPFLIEGVIANSNDPAIQTVFTKLTQATTAILSSQPMAYADWTVDTTVDQLFAITAQFGGISVATSLTYKHASVELS